MYENGIGGEVRHGVTSGVSCETPSSKHVTPHLHRECHVTQAMHAYAETDLVVHAYAYAYAYAHAYACACANMWAKAPIVLS